MISKIFTQRRKHRILDAVQHRILQLSARKSNSVELDLVVLGTKGMF